jgi:hypothetical protein
MMDGMSIGNNEMQEGALAVLASVREIIEGLSEAEDAQQGGDDLAGLATVLAAMSRPMQRDWSPAEKYQAIALLGVTVRWLSMVTEMSEEEILAELESNYR